MNFSVAFCSHVSDDWYYSVGADKLQKSMKYFHPDIPFFLFGDKELNYLFGLHPNINWNTVNPFVISLLKEKYDVVYHFDADSMVFGKMDELLSPSILEYDVIGVRNNNDIDRAGKDNPITHGNIPVQKYLNAGLVGVVNNDFLEDWKKNNIEIANRLPFQEQSVLNMLCYETDSYKTLIVDPMDSNVHYGISGLYGINTHWDSWKNMRLEGENVMLKDKIVKVVHHAGGHNSNKLSFDMFSENIQSKLNEIIN